MINTLRLPEAKGSHFQGFFLPFYDKVFRNCYLEFIVSESLVNSDVFLEFPSSQESWQLDLGFLH